MRIERIESFYKKDACIVRVTDSDGSIGIGQTSPYTADITQIVLHRLVAPRALGVEYDDSSAEGLLAFTNHILRELHKYTGTYVCRALCGIDTALWDLRGKRENKSVTQLLGGTKTEIEAYYSSMVRDCPIEWEAERMARLQKENGFTMFKLHVGPFNGEGRDFWPGRTESMIELARKTIGSDGGDIYIDPNGAFTPEWTMKLMPLFQECGVTMLEEPLPFWKVAETAQLRQEIAKYGIIMAGGEQDYNPTVWDMILSLPMADIVQPDFGYIGGFSRGLKVAERAAARGLYTTPHTSNPSLLQQMGVHFCASIEKPWISLEYGVEPNEWIDEMLVNKIIVSNGKMQVPTAPGWGAEIRTDWLASANYMESRL